MKQIDEVFPLENTFPQRSFPQCKTALYIGEILGPSDPFRSEFDYSLKLIITLSEITYSIGNIWVNLSK
jgi:hypothetical protein